MTLQKFQSTYHSSSVTVTSDTETQDQTSDWEVWEAPIHKARMVHVPLTWTKAKLVEVAPVFSNTNPPNVTDDTLQAMAVEVAPVQRTETLP
jgi:hypothetical protein